MCPAERWRLWNASLKTCYSSFLFSFFKKHKVLNEKITQEPVLPGCFLRAKAIGVMPMIDQVLISAERNDPFFLYFKFFMFIHVLILMNIG